MKKALIILAIIFGLIIVAAIAVPIIFKDDIKAAVDKELQASVDAVVVFDPDKFDLTLFRNFPNITVSIEEFGIVGRDEFEDEILLAVKRFSVVVDLFSVIFSDTPNVNAIEMEDSEVNVIVLEDGTANYDIAVEAEEVDTTTTAEEPSEFSISIDHWKITNAHVVYDDRSMKVYTELKGLNHEGSGDFTQDVFDMVTQTQVEELSLDFEGVNYMSKKQVAVDMTMNMNLPESKYTFKENSVTINDFDFGFDGFIAMPDEDIDMDLTFVAKENTFKSLLSLVPGVFTEGFEDIKTEGTLKFDGYVRGTYSEAENKMPAFNVNLLVDEAMFQYPELPTAVENIKVDMALDNQTGVIENTSVNIKDFHMDMGNNPIDAKVLIKDLKRYTMDANVNARLNLAELNTMVPMEGLDMKGIFTANLKASGYYDSIKNIIPKIDLNMALQEGYMKYEEYPIPLQDIHFTSSVSNKTGKMAETTINVDDFMMLVDGEKMVANMTITNLENYHWDVHVHGTVDLEKITNIYPLEDMTVRGKIKADIDTRGNMAALEAERYRDLPTSGSATVQNLQYKSPDLPYPLEISNSSMTFDPDKINLKNFQGTIGESDMAMNGRLTNYIGFALGENATLEGFLNFNSNTFNANQWMTEEESSEASRSETDTAELEPVIIPRNIDFVLNSNIEKVLYENLVLQDLNGKIIFRDGIMYLDGVNFNTLGGNFSMNGNYNTQKPEDPSFDVDFGVQNLAVSKAYENFATIQTLAHIAKLVNGDFSTNFKMGGKLDDDMMPVYSSLDGGGLIELANCALTGSKIINQISSVTSLASLGEEQQQRANVVRINDVEMQTELKDGRLFVKPFQVSLGGYPTTISGSNGIDGSIDYSLSMDVPAGEIGATVNKALASLTGSDIEQSSTIKLNIGLKGTHDNPKVTLLSGEAIGQQAKDVAKQAIKQQAKKALQENLGIDLGGGSNENKETTKQEAEQQKQEAREEVQKQKEETQEKVEEEVEEIKEKAKDKLKKLFGN